MTVLANTVIDEATDHFLNLFQIISPKQKKLFFYLQSFCRGSRLVFPSLDHIAEKCGCSRSTVKRAIAFFERCGILSHIRRPYRSNLYFINACVLPINFSDSRTFKKGRFTRENEPQNEPVLYVSSPEDKTRTCELTRRAHSVQSTVNGIDISQSTKQEVLESIKKLCPKKALHLTDKDVNDLVRNFLLTGHKGALISALECLNNTRRHVSNPIGFLFAMAARIKRKYTGQGQAPPPI